MTPSGTLLIPIDNMGEIALQASCVNDLVNDFCKGLRGAVTLMRAAPDDAPMVCGDMIKLFEPLLSVAECARDEAALMVDGVR